MRRWCVRGILTLAGIAWAGGLVLGVHHLARYESNAGAVKSTLEVWPATGPERNRDGFTLAVFVHPECPCSVATMSSLDKIMAHSGGNVKAYVFAVMPEGAPVEWKHSPLVAKAEAIAGVTVLEDDKGRFARQFGALTSGHAVLYDHAGGKVFSGGITDGRGHDGPNAGLAGVEAIVNGHERRVADTPVFGCSLLGE